MSKKNNLSRATISQDNNKVAANDELQHSESGIDIVTIIFGVFLTSSIIFIFINNPIDRVFGTNGSIILATLVVMDFFPIVSIIRHFLAKK